jgi:hypothetical protein
MAVRLCGPAHGEVSLGGPRARCERAQCSWGGMAAAADTDGPPARAPTPSGGRQGRGHVGPAVASIPSSDGEGALR